MDVEGVGLKDLRGEALEFIRLASDLMQVRQTGRQAGLERGWADHSVLV